MKIQDSIVNVRGISEDTGAGRYAIETAQGVILETQGGSPANQQVVDIVNHLDTTQVYSFVLNSVQRVVRIESGDAA